MKRYVTEFIGTFFLVLTIGCVVLNDLGPVFPPLVIGTILSLLVYLGIYVSGAHYNPAVTLAMWMHGGCASRDLVPYWIAQMAGASAAAGLARSLFGSGTPLQIESIPLALGAEVVFTFVLLWVIYHVAVTPSFRDNSYYGVAIGVTVTVGIFAVGGISGAVFNPAVAVGAAFFRGLDPLEIWIPIAGSLAGAALATWLYDSRRRRRQT